MTVEHAVYSSEKLIVMNASGTVDLMASKAAIRKIVDDPAYREQYRILLDLQDSTNVMSVADAYELARFMAWPDPELPTHRKVAVVVSGEHDFDFAQFLELCAKNRGVNVRAFQSQSQAVQWLEVP